MALTKENLDWQALPRIAQWYVAAVIGVGAVTIAAWVPHEPPPPGLFIALVIASCVTSTWKVNLPIPMSSGSTLSMSYAADLMALLLLGPAPALLVAVAGALAQCTLHVKQRYPAYRTAFSVAAEAITMAVTGTAYMALGGRIAPVAFDALARPVVGAIAAYFVVNTLLVAGAIAASTGQSVSTVWRTDFLWSAAGFVVAGSAGAVAAVITARADIWVAILMATPVYLAYWTYSTFVGRLEDTRRYAEDTRRLHEEATSALRKARESEQALLEEKERLMVTLRSIGDAVIATDMDGTILLMNSLAESMTGWPRDEALGRPLTAVLQNVSPETSERLDNSLATLLGRGDTGIRRSSILVARDHLTEHPIEECAAPLRDAEGHIVGLVLVFRDISDALRVQEERAKANRLDSLGLLAGGIAHDFNNILLAIMGNITLARATGVSGGPAAAALGEAEQACVRARQITWQLLTFAKGGVPVKKPVTLRRVLDEAAALALRGSNVSATFDVGADLWPIEADEAQLVQVFTNLLINAQQAMPRGGEVVIRGENIFELTERAQFALRVEPGAYVRVSIVDQGIGIPKEHLTRIFDPYFSTKHRGSGLGLATTYSIVKNHGGLIGVESELGRGTTIQVHFRAAMSRARRDPAPLVVASGENRPRVLVMDDEASIRMLAANMLEFLGYDAEVVDNGNAAIESFGRAMNDGGGFDVVLLDLVVPGELGAREAIDQIVRLDPTVKAVLVSGYAQDAAMSAYRDYGFAAAMTKPYTLQELRAVLETVGSRVWRVH